MGLLSELSVRRITGKGTFKVYERCQPLGLHAKVAGNPAIAELAPSGPGPSIHARIF
jgi:hypothetical protein